MSHNCLSSLCDLSGLPALARLYLDDNRLTELPAALLPASLRTLSAAANRLEAVTGLHGLTRLTALHLPGNRLAELCWLPPLPALHILNVAGNRLCSLACLPALSAVPHLSRLSVSDAQYGPNPVCGLHQWRVLALHSLPRLLELDEAAVTPAAVERAESVWRHKSVYYSRCRQRVKRVATELQRALGTRCQQAVDALDRARRAAWHTKCAVDEVSWAAEEQRIGDSGVQSGQTAALAASLADCTGCVGTAVARCNAEARRLLASYRSMQRSLAVRQQALLRALGEEMDSGGNVRWDESEQLTRCAARLLDTPSTAHSAADVQLVRAVRLKDGEHSNRALSKQEQQQQQVHQSLSSDRSGRVFAQSALEEEQTRQLWFTTSLDGGHTDLPASASAPLPSTPATLHRSALAALSVATPRERSGRTQQLLACTLLSTARRIDETSTQRVDAEGRRERGEQLQLTSLPTVPDVRTVTDACCVLPHWLLSVRVRSSTATAGAAVAAVEGSSSGSGGERLSAAGGRLSLLSSLPSAVLTLTAEVVGLRECVLDVAEAVESCERSGSEQRMRLRDVASTLLNHLPPPLSARCGTVQRIADGETSTAPLLRSSLSSERALDLTASASCADRLYACARGLRDIGELGAVQWSRLSTLVLSCNALTSLPLRAAMPLLHSLDVSHNQIALPAFSAQLFSLMPALSRLGARHNRLELDRANRQRTLTALLHCTSPCQRLQHIDWGAQHSATATDEATESSEMSGSATGDDAYFEYAQRALTLFPALLTLDSREVRAAADGCSDKRAETSSDASLDSDWQLSFSSNDCRAPAPAFLTDELMQRHSVTASTREQCDAAPHIVASPISARDVWPSNVVSLELDHLALTSLTVPVDAPGVSAQLPLTRFVQLHSLSLNGNLLHSLDRLTAAPLPSLTHLSVERNQLSALHLLDQFPALTRLDASGNCLAELSHARLHQLTALSVLQLEHNRLRSLEGLQRCTALAELRVQHNQLADGREWQRLVDCELLRVLDARANPCHTSDACRLFVVYCLPRLHTLDERAVSSEERDAALERHCGRLTREALVESVGEQRMAFIQHLALTHCRLRRVDAISQSALPSLRSLRLDHNSLASTHSLQPHSTLTALHCSHNQLAELATLHSAVACRERSGLELPAASLLQRHAPEDNWLSLAYPRLHRLVVDHNQLPSLHALHLHGLTALRTLSAAHNRIARLDLPLAALVPSLTQLVLADNRISQVEPAALDLCTRLAALQLDGNALSHLPATDTPLASLTALHLADNKCGDLCDLDGLSQRCMPALAHLTLAGCPLARRHSYRALVLQHTLPSAVLSIDGQPVTAEEAEAAMRQHVDAQHSADGVGAPPVAQLHSDNSHMPGEVARGTGRQQLGSREAQWAERSAAVAGSGGGAPLLLNASGRSVLPALSGARSGFDSSRASHQLTQTNRAPAATLQMRSR